VSGPAFLLIFPRAPLAFQVFLRILGGCPAEYIIPNEHYILGRLVKQTQRDRAYRHIRGKLAAGSLAAGVRLSPAALAREIGVSHIPVREAISQLESDGLVVHVAHRGAFVKGPDRQELVDLIELRAIIECHAAGRAATRIGGPLLDELEDRWQTLCKLAEAFRVPPGSDLAEPLGQWLLGDLAFHMALLRAAGNRRAIKVIEDTRVMTQMFGYRTDSPAAWASPAAFGEANLRVHRDVYEAVRRRDPKAARRAMAVHMRRAGKNLLARFDWLQRQGDAERARAGDFPDSMRRLVLGIQRRDLADLPRPADGAFASEGAGKRSRSD
jgi:DNA-binding GntR family transcriptional regulator